MTRARSALAAECRFVSALLDATTALVLSIDPNGRILRCNSAWEAIVGIPRTEIEGRYAWECLPLSAEEVRHVLRQCREAGGTQSFETTFALAGGREYVVAWSTVGVHEPNGELACVVATGQDITRHRAAERKLRNAYELEHRIAKTLQESLLRPVPKIPGLNLGVAYRPAIEAERVGGDFYDVYRLGEDRVVAVVGDVSGKGVQAAGLTETVRSTLRALIHTDLSPEDALSRAGRVLYEQTVPEQFATVALALLDLRTGELHYASAGHPAPVLRADKTRFLPVPNGVPLGAYPYSYERTTWRLDPGDCLVMYTDGLCDARHAGRFFLDEGLLHSAQSQPPEPSALVHGLLEAAESFSRAPLADDIAIVALQLPAA